MNLLLSYSAYFNCSISFLIRPYCLCPTCSDAVDSLTSLYNHVEEQVHNLVQSSNMSLEHLKYLLQVREMEGHFTQVGATKMMTEMNILMLFIDQSF